MEELKDNPYSVPYGTFEHFIDRKARKNVTFVVQTNLAEVLKYVKVQREQKNNHIFQFPRLAGKELAGKGMVMAATKWPKNCE